MPFPEFNRVVYKKTPLLQVVCQLRYPPILAVGASDPAQYQNLVRSDYPLYEKRAAVAQQVASAFQSMSIPLPSSTVLHAFGSEDNNREIALATEALTFTDNKYDRWEQFFSYFTLAREALEKVYSPAFYSRLGLRYVNLIYRQDLGLRDAAWPDLVNAALAGMLGDESLQTDVTDLTTTAVLSLDQHALVRIKYGLAKEVARPDDVGFLVDVDFQTTAKEGGSDVAAKLAKFNRAAGSLFRWAITDKLHRAMEPSDLESGG